ncbi:MAG: hypothetical protein K2J08_08100 [Ruminococcus sp.]|nr:hypothetical protein [Ruminococcus sp.]
MIKMTNLEEIKAFPEPKIKEYIFNKATQMMTEYDVENLDDIGCFVVLDGSENQMFEISEMEFVEVLNISNKTYLHGVKILGDSYGEDIYMPVEVVKC